MTDLLSILRRANALSDPGSATSQSLMERAAEVRALLHDRYDGIPVLAGTTTNLVHTMWDGEHGLRLRVSTHIGGPSPMSPDMPPEVCIFVERGKERANEVVLSPDEAAVDVAAAHATAVNALRAAAAGAGPGDSAREIVDRASAAISESMCADDEDGAAAASSERGRGAGGRI